MTLAWRFNRARAMGLRELGYRGARAVQAALEMAGVGLARPAPPVGATGCCWVTQLTRDVDVSTYRESADLVLAGQFEVFARLETQLGFPPVWNRCCKTGIDSPMTFGKALDYRDASTVGDIKYLWEPNRHHELVTLAQAWFLTGEERYAVGCQTLIDSWIGQCPYPLGPNWTSSLEHGIRLINWAFAWHLLGGEHSALFETPSGEAFRRRWLASVAEHCHFIFGHLSRYSSANNHLLGELAGLFVGATTWPLWADSSKWRHQAFAEFEREALAQTFGDGVSREQAAWYHHAVADMMIVVGLFGRANGSEFGNHYWARLEKMLEFVASTMDISGNVPSIGDADDGVIVRLAPVKSFDVYRSLLATGAVLFERDDFKQRAAAFDDKSRWLLGDDASPKFNAIASSADGQRLPRAFPDGGYYVLGSDLGTEREVRIVADVGALGYLSTAAHGHADALAFTLSAAGREMLIDSGTYAYHTEKEWRDYFRGTSAHNTLQVDGECQSRSGGNFLWLGHAQSRCESWTTLPDSDELIGSHDGYRRLESPVRHRRSLLYRRTMRLLAITDELVGQGRHRVSLHWHSAPGCVVTLQPRFATIVADDVCATITWPQDLSAELVRGRASPPLGWVSRRFDVKEPCVTLAVSGEVQAPWRGMTQIAIAVGS